MVQFWTQQSTCLVLSNEEGEREREGGGGMEDWSSNSHLRLPASAFKAAIHHQFLCWPPDVHTTRQHQVRND